MISILMSIRSLKTVFCVRVALCVAALFSLEKGLLAMEVQIKPSLGSVYESGVRRSSCFRHLEQVKKTAQHRFLEALRHNNFFLACRVADEQPDLINQKDTDGNTLLHKLVIDYQNGFRTWDYVEEILTIALQKGATLNLVNNGYQTVIDCISRDAHAGWRLARIKWIIENFETSCSVESISSNSSKSSLPTPQLPVGYRSSCNELRNEVIQDNVLSVRVDEDSQENLSLIESQEEDHTVTDVSRNAGAIHKDRQSSVKIPATSTILSNTTVTTLLVAGVLGAAAFGYYTLLPVAAKNPKTVSDSPDNSPVNVVENEEGETLKMENTIDLLN